MKLISRGPAETGKAGRGLAKRLKAGDTVLLFGDLGAGKTVFVKGIAEALGISGREITSASFTIISEHFPKKDGHGGGGCPLYHIDLYRVEGETDLESTGIYDYIGGDGIAVIEWAERMPDINGETIKVRINILSGKRREILIEGLKDALFS